MGCKSICLKYKAKGSFIGGRYKFGQRRCQVCDLFIKYDGIWCPCCGYKLRSKPRNKKYKQKFRASEAIKT